MSQVTPRPHQKAALAAIAQGLKRSDRGQVLMACGTGKSFVGAWAAEQSKASTVLVLVPSLALVRQMLADYRRAVGWPRWSALAVCSDETVSDDDVRMGPEDVGCDVTTDRALVKRFLCREGVRVVFCTYHSSPVLHALRFDLAIFDEAHKTAGNSDSAFRFALNDEQLSIGRRLFFTATPRVAAPAQSGFATVAAMDNPHLYGPVFHRLSFREAVARHIICDYEIVVSEVVDSVDTQGRVPLQVAVECAMRTFGLRKAFAFHPTVADARAFAANDFGAFGPDVDLLHVSGAMPTAAREGVMERFRQANRAVVTNARCLTEGVDVPAVDMVVFANAKKSVVDVVQAAGRAMRRAPGKERGYIFVPLWRDESRGETEDAAAQRSGFKDLLDILRALSTHDELLESALARLREADERDDTAPSSAEELGLPLRICGADVDGLRRAVRIALSSQARPHHHWTPERCRAAAAKFTSRHAFQLGAPGAHNAAYKNGWMDDVCSHMARQRKQWDRESVAAEAAKYQSRTEFRYGAKGAYKHALDNGMLDDVCRHMESSRKPKGHWESKEACLAEAAKYPTRSAFAVGHRVAYDCARANGWLDEFFEEAAAGRRPPEAHMLDGGWTPSHPASGTCAASRR